MKTGAAGSGRVVLGVLGFLAAGLALGACRSAGGGGWAPEPGPHYARFDLRVERDACMSTNYRLGPPATSVPINTPVELVSARRGTFQMRVVDGAPFALKHVPKHTQDTAEQAFAAFFSPAPTDLAAFTAEEREAIAKGEVRPGMSRAAVLASLGPPPAIGTPSLDSPAWKYWSTRFATFFVRFGDDGRVTDVGR